MKTIHFISSLSFMSSLVVLISCSNGESKKSPTATNTSTFPQGAANATIFDANTYNLGVQYYAQFCQNCHATLTSSTKLGRSATQISNAIASVPTMASLQTNLPSSYIPAIGMALTYRADGTLFASTQTSTFPSTQSNTLTSTGTSTANATEGASLYASYCQNCHNQISASTKRMKTASQIISALTTVPQMNQLRSALTDAQIQNIASALAR